MTDVPPRDPYCSTCLDRIVTGGIVVGDLRFCTPAHAERWRP